VHYLHDIVRARFEQVGREAPRATRQIIDLRH
jgi:hypothetical protein